MATTTMVSVAAALLLACAAFVALDVAAFREMKVRSQMTQAEILSRQVTSALLFRDPEAAARALSALEANATVARAAVYDADGNVFAAYARDGADRAPLRVPSTLVPGTHLFADGRLYSSKPAVTDATRVGTVVLEAELSELDARRWWYLGIATAVMLVCLALASAMASALQRSVSGPVLHLAETAVAVSERQDYSVRAQAQAHGELGVLVRTFNHMLDQIEDRTAELRGARDDLERQVDARTADLQREVAERRALADELRATNVELQRQSARVQEATRLKSEFLANMSHELRTPLNGIIGFAELLHDGRVGSVTAAQSECLADILTSARHLLNLINDVLDLSKVEAGKMEFRPSAVPPEKLVGEVRDILRPLSARKRIVVSMEIDPDLREVVVDPGKLKQVLYNFLSNALKFTPEEGRVVIRAAGAGPDRFRVEVEDSGIGIAPEDVTRLFEEFRQLDAGMSKAHQGTGLGLALTRRIVEAQGGSVGVQSVRGRGSLFYAELPRVTTSEDTAPGGSARAAGAGVTVLVVDDDAEERAWLRQTLAAGGYTVDEETTVAGAATRCAERVYDAVVLDLLLPDGSGWDVLRGIRQGGPNQSTPVIVVTVVAEKHEGAAFAIQDYLVKPVGAPQLLAALQRAKVPPSDREPVLVVDDDAQARKLLDTMLRSLGYRALLASSGPEGLEVAARERLAAVILDLLMPGMDGFSFLHDFRDRDVNRGTPVIVWTAKDLTRDDYTRLADAAQGVVLKRHGGAGPLVEELQLHIRAGTAPNGG